jgi:hypothetical protein
MKVQATITLEFQAPTLAEAGALLDDVLGRARERDDVGVGRVEVLTPPGDTPVALPSVTRTGFAAGTPSRAGGDNGA